MMPDNICIHHKTGCNTLPSSVPALKNSIQKISHSSCFKYDIKCHVGKFRKLQRIKRGRNISLTQCKYCIFFGKENTTIRNTHSHKHTRCVQLTLNKLLLVCYFSETNYLNNIDYQYCIFSYINSFNEYIL